VDFHGEAIQQGAIHRLVVQLIKDSTGIFTGHAVVAGLHVHRVLIHVRRSFSSAPGDGAATQGKWKRAEAEGSNRDWRTVDRLAPAVDSKSSGLQPVNRLFERLNHLIDVGRRVRRFFQPVEVAQEDFQRVRVL
jgi:hypothetical protein